jgi:hypothetical protein
MGGVCSTHGQIRRACIILVLKPGRKSKLGRPVRKYEDNVKSTKKSDLTRR